MADFNFFAPRTKQEPEKKKKKREPLDHSWATRPHGNCCEGDSELCPRWTARIDEGACETWTYPNNYPVRQYQEQIVKQALLKNTLVCLPTGLGKTLIAAVLMYNYHRWFPDGQIIFMAPTKPLVAQQVEACHDVVGLPEEDTAQLDGNVPVERRRELWRKRRVFYCTPQTVANDLAKGVFDASRVVLLVVDEAHRALKKYAYCSVVKHVGFRHAHFRVLALSATPGSDVAGVQDVVDNLRYDLGVPRCCGPSTPSTRVVSRRRGRSDRVERPRRPAQDRPRRGADRGRPGRGEVHAPPPHREDHL